MLVLRLVLAFAVAVGVAALVLYLFTGRKDYLRFFGRAALWLLAALALLGVGTLVGRLFGVFL